MTLAIELDGLVQRFGRLVPDTAALLDRISLLRDQAAGGLDVVLVRFGTADEAMVARDLEALNLSSTREALGARVSAMPNVRDLAPRFGPRTMLFAGGAVSAREALSAGVPAYLVSDRRLPDHRRLPIWEADRVVAESLRLAVPRPMSDEVRRGQLLAVEAGPATQVRDRGLALLRHDERADWFTLGARQIVYVESMDAAEWLRQQGAELLADGIRRDDLALARTVSAPEGRVLVEGPEHRLGLFSGPGTVGWRSLRRARLGVPDQQDGAKDVLTLPSLRHVGGWLRWLAAGAGVAEPFPALRARSGLLDDTSVRCLAVPFATPDSETLIALAQSELLGPPAATLALALRERGEASGLLLCGAAAQPLDAVRHLLWEQEQSRLRALLQVRRASDAAKARVAAEPSAPAEPVRLTVDVPETPEEVRSVADGIIAAMSQPGWPG